MIEVPVRVKEALGDGSYLKNYRFIILDENGQEEFTIDNNNLIKESVSIDERLCSGDTIKFGLCEGSQLQFEYFGFPDITGRRLQAFIDVQYKATDKSLNLHSIPIGFFDVKDCPMQFSTGIRRCTCYNKLKSDYLDANAMELVSETIAKGDGSDSGIAIVSILDSLLEGYSISVAPDVNVETNIYGGAKGYNHFVFSEHDTAGVTQGNGKYLHVYKIDVFLTSEDGCSKDEFYKIVAAVKKISDYTKRLRENVTTKYYSYGILKPGYSMQGYAWEEFYQTIKYNDYAQYGTSLVIKNASGNDIFKSLEFSEYEIENLDIGYFTNLEGKESIRLSIPVMYKLNISSNNEISDNDVNTMNMVLDEMINTIPEMVLLYRRNLSEIEKYRITEEQLGSVHDVTLRKLQSAVFELSAQYGKLDRETDLFSGVELNNRRLFPAETIFPHNDLYPYGTAVRARKSTYQQLWAEDGSVKKFRYLIITYKTLDEEGKETEKVLQRTVNSDGNTNYNMSDNWMFKNLTWTEEEVAAYAERMVKKMRNITWFPFEMWSVGLPFIETGDEIEIVVGDGAYTTYVLQRQMKGIQNLSDSYINGTVNIF